MKGNKLSKYIVYSLLFVILSLVLILFNSKVVYAYVTPLTGIQVSDGSLSNGVVTNTVNVKSSSGCTGTTYTEQSKTITITNVSGSSAIVLFSYEATGQGSATIDGNTVSTGNYSKLLDNNGTISITIKSGGSEGNSETITLRDWQLIDNSDRTLIFNASTGGSITVAGSQVSTSKTVVANYVDGVAVTATASSGYAFYAWVDASNNVINTTANTTIKPTADATIHALFVSTSAPLFKVGNIVYTNLTAANNAASSGSSKTIILVKNGTLSSGSYNISSGVTLLIPMDDANTLYTTTPTVVYGSHSPPSAFRTLTMASGATITVYNGGKICVPSKLSATGTGAGSWNGTPTGAHGRISMSSGSSIFLNSGSGLYCYGYISGDGVVTAHSGSTVYEAMQFRCWRGGSATSGMTSGVFPLSQYYVQNIEASLIIETGATEKIYTSVNASSRAYPASATFIGSDGMFRLTSGSLTKRFDKSNDRVYFTVDGDTNISSLSIDLDVISVDSASYVLPINSNITIICNSGVINTDQNQKIALLPGSELIINYNCELNIKSELIVYDYTVGDPTNEWGSYACDGKEYVPVGYTAANGTVSKRQALVDAKIDMNGIMNITSTGKLYTTISGANIMSSDGTGYIYFNSAAPSDTTTQQATQSGTSITRVSITITAAKLKNTDGTYVETAGSTAGKYYYYCQTHSSWETGDNEVVFYSNAPTGTSATGTMNHQRMCARGNNLEECRYTIEGYHFIGWTTNANGTGGSFANEALLSASDFNTYGNPLSLYANWEINKYTITWKNYDGTVLKTDVNVVHGTTPTYDGETPTRASTVQYTYTFNGWDPTVSTATNDIVYTATFTQTTRTYSVTIQSNNESYGTVSQSTIANVPYGTTVSVSNNTITINGTTVTATAASSTTEYTYAFSQWSVSNGATITGATTITATFTRSGRTYTVTIQSNNNSYGTVSQSTIANVPHGATITVSSNTITINGTTVTATAQSSTAQYTYAFSQWSVSNGATITGATTITATFTQTTRTYTITWNDDGGVLIDTTTVEYGVVPTHADPTKASTAQYTYTFNGWSPTVVAVTGATTYTATFTATTRTYTVTIQSNNEDYGTVSRSSIDNVPYGTSISVSSNTITINGTTVTATATSSTAQYTYEFSQWSVSDGATTTESTTITATFTQTAVLYNITFSYDGVTKNYTYTLVSDFTFPNSSDFTGSHPYTVKKWTHNTLSNQEPGDAVRLTTSYNNETFTAFTGGYYQESSNVYYIEPTRDTFTNGLIKGLYNVNRQDGTDKHIYYFDTTDGHLVLNNAGIITFNSKEYYINAQGYVDKHDELYGVTNTSTSTYDYYYFTDKNYAINSGSHYLELSDENLPSGYYTFSNNIFARNDTPANYNHSLYLVVVTHSLMALEFHMVY